MRISGGTAKGRNIGCRKAFKKRDESDELRPTSAKVREAVFDIIRDNIRGARFLDLYAGTGSVGFEALSRDAAEVVFVESSGLRAKLINRLLSEFRQDEKALVIRADVCGFIKKESGKEGRYDIIFMDPPYGSEELAEALEIIGGSTLLVEGGMAIAEHFTKRPLPDSFGRLNIKKRYRYGDTTLSVYRMGG